MVWRVEEQKGVEGFVFLCRWNCEFVCEASGGITLVVDIDEMKIVEYYDRFIVPVPKAEGTECRESKLEPPFGPRLNGATLVNPYGPRFKIHKHTIRSVFFLFYLNVFVREILHEL